MSSSTAATGSATKGAGAAAEAAEAKASGTATYEAGCHCGYVKFSLALSPPLPEYKVVRCNCSICSKKGYLLVC